MSSIRITKVPSGVAPLWVRENWIGLEISLTEPMNDPALDYDGYEVSINVALRVLRKKSERAANWFEENLLSFNGNFKFQKEECEYLP